MNKPVRCLACGSHETFDLFSLGKVPPVNGFSVLFELRQRLAPGRLCVLELLALPVKGGS